MSKSCIHPDRAFRIGIPVAMYSSKSLSVTILILILICVTSERVLVNGAFRNCRPYEIIPESKYDKDSASLRDYSKRPNGFKYGLAEYPTTGTNLINPCVTLQNLTDRAVEVKMETLIAGSKICARDDGGNSLCGTGTFSKCWNAHTDTVKFEFYCDPAMGCDSDVQFWYRLVPSVGDRDDWCTLYRKNDYPSSLFPIPSNVPTQSTPTSSSSLAAVSYLLVILTGLVTYCLYITSR